MIYFLPYKFPPHYNFMICMVLKYNINRVSWPSGLVHWTQVLVLSECGFESRPGRSRRLCPWARHFKHNCFVLRMGRKAVGPVCCVMHVKEPSTLIVKEKGLAPVFLDSRLEHPAGWICVRVTNLLYYSVLIILFMFWLATGSRTPHYGSQTPLHDGSQTPISLGFFLSTNPFHWGWKANRLSFSLMFDKRHCWLK